MMPGHLEILERAMAAIRALAWIREQPEKRAADYM
jgi:hypothetical protein